MNLCIRMRRVCGFFRLLCSRHIDVDCMDIVNARYCNEENDCCQDFRHFKLMLHYVMPPIYYMGCCDSLSHPLA